MLAVLVVLVARTDAVADTDRAVAAAGLDPSDVGYAVIDIETGEMLAAHNPDTPLIPASVAKVATAIAALELLGPEHRFATELFATGPVTADGVLDGALFLRGGGDPFLSGDKLRAMARALQAAGVREVRGAFLFDPGDFPGVDRIDVLQPEAASYNTGVSTLSVNFNRVRAEWDLTGAEPALVVSAVSETVREPLSAVALVRSDEPLPAPLVRSEGEDSDLWHLSATVGGAGWDWLPVEDPPEVAAELFHRLAGSEGVTLPPPVEGSAPRAALRLVRHDSEPLTEIVGGLMEYSNNLTAELLGIAVARRLGADAGGTIENLAVSTDAMARFWREALPGVDWTGWWLVNHSGLASRSRATARQLAEIIRFAARSERAAPFIELMSARSYRALAGTGASVRAKTGTMSFVRGLGGVILARSGRRLAFAYLANDLDKRAALDAAFDPKTPAREPGAGAFRDRAIGFESRLVVDWARRF